MEGRILFIQREPAPLKTEPRKKCYMSKGHDMRKCANLGGRKSTSAILTLTIVAKVYEKNNKKKRNNKQFYLFM
jgi:hypothetical protein